jgi:hypothetical protein
MKILKVSLTLEFEEAMILNEKIDLETVALSFRHQFEELTKDVHEGTNVTIETMIIDRISSKN